ncbi:MAG TPA: acetate--CoA ligase family protein, partial [Actinomycetota bacterium]|nr:acetate--CoA ligase family protein [Actinomycetota bacterium]
IDAVFRQCGVLRAHGFSDLQDFAQGFSRAGRLPRGRRVAIVTNAGGPAVMTTDALEGSGLEVAELAEVTRDRLELVLPEAASTANPVDVLGDAQADRYDEALDAVMRDPGVDATIVLLTPQVMTEPETTARHVVREAKQSDKPVIAVFMGGEDIAGGVHVLDKGRVPVYDSPERAVRTLAMLAYYHDYLHFEREPAPVFEVDRAAVASVLDGARERGDRTLTGLEAARLFGAYGFPVLEGRVVGGPDEAVAHAEKAGWPVALKIASADVLHKMDVGAVRVDLRTETALRRAYGEILANVREHVPQARIDGMLVEPMAPRGREVILGMSRDPQFGPVILFGLGGVYVEVLKDVTFRLAPMLPLSARRMLGEIRARALLDGVRGEPPSDKAAIVDGLLRLSQLAVEQPGIAEVDVNPLIVTASGATGVDYRVILTEPGAAAAQR